MPFTQQDATALRRKMALGEDKDLTREEFARIIPAGRPDWDAPLDVLEARHQRAKEMLERREAEFAKARESVTADARRVVEGIERRIARIKAEGEAFGGELQRAEKELAEARDFLRQRETQTKEQIADAKSDARWNIDELRERETYYRVLKNLRRQGKDPATLLPERLRPRETPKDAALVRVTDFKKGPREARALGGTFDPVRKVWAIPAARLEGKDLKALGLARVDTARPREPESGAFVEKAAWDQGLFYVTKDTDTGKATFSKDRPQGVPLVEGPGSARKSYTVLSRDNDPPVDDTVNLGIVDARAGENLTFKPRPVTRRGQANPTFVAQKRGGGFMVRDLRTGAVKFTKKKPRGAKTVRNVFAPRSPGRRRRFADSRGR